MTQMIGRALRGRKAGGADEANIVMFMDEWKRLIEWATPASLDGVSGSNGTKSSAKVFSFVDSSDSSPGFRSNLERKSLP
jgi:superfamily II DNA or RNA helicase